MDLRGAFTFFLEKAKGRSRIPNALKQTNERAREREKSAFPSARFHFYSSRLDTRKSLSSLSLSLSLCLFSSLEEKKRLLSNGNERRCYVQESPRNQRRLRLREDAEEDEEREERDASYRVSRARFKARNASDENEIKNKNKNNEQGQNC